MIRTLKTLIVVIFGYLTYATIQIGPGKMHGLGTWFKLLVLGTVGYFICKGFRLRGLALRTGNFSVVRLPAKPAGRLLQNYEVILFRTPQYFCFEWFAGI